MYDVIEKARGYAIVVSLSYFQNRERLDIREHYEHRPGDAETLRPTKKGISIVVTKLPRLLAALHKAEAEAIRSGHLTAKQYHDAGIEPPAELITTPAAA